MKTFFHLEEVEEEEVEEEPGVARTTNVFIRDAQNQKTACAGLDCSLKPVA